MLKAIVDQPKTPQLDDPPKRDYGWALQFLFDQTLPLANVEFTGVPSRMPAMYLKEVKEQTAEEIEQLW